MRGVAEAVSLAKKEMKSTWLSYSLSGLLVLLVSLFATVSVSGVFELKGFGAMGQRTEEYYNAFFTDCLFLMVCAFLGVNVVSKDCMAPLVRDGWRGTFSLRTLPVLRRLPLSAGDIVGSRLILMLVALAFNATLFFIVAYSLSGLGDLGGSYLWFAGVWLGYSLLAAGLYLASELTLAKSGKAHVLLSSFVFTASLMVFVALLEWALELALVERTAKLAESHGALAAIFSILAGGASLVLLSWLTARRIQKRGLSV